MVLRAVGVVHENKELDTLTIYKPLYDIRDALDNQIKASLLSDGTGIMYTEPKATTYLSKDIVKIHRMENQTDNDREPLHRAHRVAANNIKKDSSRQQKKVLLQFPDGITCSVGHFSRNQKNPQLKNNKRMMNVNENDTDPGTAVQFVFWQMVIDGAPRNLDSSDESDDSFKDCRKRMADANMGD